jgi:putative membrane protein
MITLGDGYNWVKALHAISVISWMAGLLYMPRLFVYHTTAAPGSETSELFKVMERRLYRAIMTPAMIATWLFGVTMLAAQPGFFHFAWLHVKLACVVGMTVTHVLMGRWKDDFAADRNSRPQRFFRIANEVPTLLMIVIVIMVIVKP